MQNILDFNNVFHKVKQYIIGSLLMLITRIQAILIPHTPLLAETAKKDVARVTAVFAVAGVLSEVYVIFRRRNVYD